MVLADELQPLHCIISRPAASWPEDLLKVPAICIAVKSGWRDVIFGEHSTGTLARYFQYQLKDICDLSDIISDQGVPASVIQGCLLELIDHLFKFYSPYLDDQVAAPVAYRICFAEKMTLHAEMIKVSSHLTVISPPLLAFLTAFFEELPGTLADVGHAFSSLRYLSNLAERLRSLSLKNTITDDDINSLFLEIDLNHLGYYAYWQERWQFHVKCLTAAQKLEMRQRELQGLYVRPEQSKWHYDANWPSLRTMLINFLQEELRSKPQVVFTDPADTLPKIPLDLSVAQLACLLRSLTEEGCFGPVELQYLFNFFALNFRTKRQGTISGHSLSKEYYSINQVTAAVMRDKLKRMVDRISRNFFPE